VAQSEAATWHSIFFLCWLVQKFVMASGGFEPSTSVGAKDFVKGGGPIRLMWCLLFHMAYSPFELSYDAWFGIGPSRRGASPRPGAVDQGQASKRAHGSIAPGHMAHMTNAEAKK
jgi:hypothetical protein